jgi:hypothetical protein
VRFVEPVADRRVTVVPVDRMETHAPHDTVVVTDDRMKPLVICELPQSRLNDSARIISAPRIIQPREPLAKLAAVGIDELEQFRGVGCCWQSQSMSITDQKDGRLMAGRLARNSLTVGWHRQLRMIETDRMRSGRAHAGQS